MSSSINRSCGSSEPSWVCVEPCLRNCPSPPEKNVSLIFVPPVVNITSEKFHVGRAPNNDFIIDCINVSRKHAVITKYENKWKYTSLGNNEDSVNDQTLRMGDEITITSGTVIQIGTHPQCKFIFTITNPENKDHRQYSEDLSEIVSSARAEVVSLQNMKALAEEDLHAIENRKKSIQQELMKKRNDTLSLTRMLQQCEDEIKSLQSEDGRLDSSAEMIHEKLLRVDSELKMKYQETEEKLGKAKNVAEAGLDSLKRNIDSIDGKFKNEMKKWRKASNGSNVQIDNEPKSRKVDDCEEEWIETRTVKTEKLNL